MHQRFFKRRSWPRVLVLSCAGAALAFVCGTAAPDNAFAVTAAEMRAEADSAYAEIDSLQTTMNKAKAEYERAQKAQEVAVKKRDEAAAAIQRETEHVNTLQSDLSDFAVGMYKSGGQKRFIDVIFDSQSFEEFITSWDTYNLIFEQGDAKLNEAREARASLEQAKADYEAQSKRAEEEMAASVKAQEEAQKTQAALREKAKKLTVEADKLQVKEELYAEAARQAEEARQRQEADLEAAAQAAEEAKEAKRARAAQRAENEATEYGSVDGMALTVQSSGDVADADGADEADVVETDPEFADEQAEDIQDDVVTTEARGASALDGEYEVDVDGIDASMPVVMSAGFFANPCPDADYSSGFGYRKFDDSFHQGLDMAADEGTPYYAAESGTVIAATNSGKYNGGAGNWVVIAHGNNIVTKYMHSSETLVEVGDYVERGQKIGLVGNTGNSSGPHLHFQLEVNDVAIDPLKFI